MIKAFLRFCALCVLCALIVFAPELYKAVSHPYALSGPQRVLLRIALCSDDSAAANAFDRALSIYMKEHPSLHLRISRHEGARLFSLPDPQPDLFVFPESLRVDASRFDTLFPFSSHGCEPLRCAISKDSANPQTALDLLSTLCGDPPQ